MAGIAGIFDMYTLTCKSCNSLFTSASPAREFCSTTCKKRNNNSKRAYVRSTKFKIAALDFETDPFKFGSVIKPFAYGLLLEDGTYYSSWDSDETDFLDGLLKVINDLPDNYIIYAHNGGRFDFFFLLDKIYGGIPDYSKDNKGFFLINNRMTRIAYNNHEFRDSYSIMPVPLKTSGTKLEIDYELMSVKHRYKQRSLIDEYLKADCESLLAMVLQYKETFGKSGKMPLTMASAAFDELKHRHDFKKLPISLDSIIREYYAGGHTQCYVSGIVYAPHGGKINLFDVNSEYPSVMKFYEHPIGDVWIKGDVITDNTFFIEWEGRNYGAVFQKTRDGVDFTVEQGVFKTTIHEYKQALELGLIEVDNILSTYDCDERTNFAVFVDEFFNRRLASAAVGDDILVLFWKLVLNSAYGKFGQNAENFGNYRLVIKDSDDYKTLCYSDDFISETSIETLINGEQYVIIKSSLSKDEIALQSRYNVATAASITGAARALLMRGLHACIKDAIPVIYCDTDSIFAWGYPTSLDIVKDKTLGKWNHEAQGEVMALAGKKQYALFDKHASYYLDNPELKEAYTRLKWKKETYENFACRYKSKTYKPPKGFAYIPHQESGELVLWACNKMASKGTRISPQAIVDMAYDSSYENTYHNFAPTFSLTGSQSYITRRTKNTCTKNFSFGKTFLEPPILTKSIHCLFEYE